MGGGFNYKQTVNYSGPWRGILRSPVSRVRAHIYTHAYHRYIYAANRVTFVPTRKLLCAPTCLRFQLHGLFPAITLHAGLPTDRPHCHRRRRPYFTLIKPHRNVRHEIKKKIIPPFEFPRLLVFIFVFFCTHNCFLYLTTKCGWIFLELL